MSIRLTPGLSFLLRCAPQCLVPVFVGVALQWISGYFAFAIPTWFLVIISILSLPICAAAIITFNSASDKRRAAFMGASMIPLVHGDLPGNIDILRTMVNHFKHGYPGDGLWEMCAKLGSIINLRILWQDGIFTSDPNHIKMILATDFDNFVKGEQFRDFMYSVLGTGVFNSDGEMWRFHRSMTKKFFTKDRVRHFDIFDRHTDEAIEQVRSRLKAGYAVDIQDVMGRFTLDSATEFLFGSCVHSLSAGLPYPHNVAVSPESFSLRNNSAQKFAQAFLQAQYLVSERVRLGNVWPLFELFQNKTDKPMQIINAYIEPIIRGAVEKQKEAPATDGKSSAKLEDDETALDHLVKHTSDPVVLRDETLNILIAGRDTTASTLTFIIYFLAIHPHVLTRLREEILEKVGPTRRPTYDEIRDLKYLRAVINETMRLYPAVPFNVRQSIHATTFPSSDPTGDPIYIPPNTDVSYSVLMMHRRKDLWGPDADEFDPDRFLDHRLQKYLVPNPFIFLPFNAGPRICLGQQFAYNEISFMLIRLLQKITSITLDPEAQPPESHPPKHWATAEGRKAIERIFPKSHLTMYVAGGLWVRMGEADGANAARRV